MKKKISAFSLFEALLALLVISQSVLVIIGLTKILNQQIVASRQNTTKDWQIFCQQMRAELGQAKLVKVEQNYLFVSTDKDLRYGLVGEDFRKTDANGRGYQPMLYGIKKVEMSQQGQTVSLELNFEQGGKRTFIYTFLEATE
ncbi:MAG: competence type IV pilus minor pilin ComGF [Lactococcus sp.]